MRKKLYFGLPTHTVEFKVGDLVRARPFTKEGLGTMADIILPITRARVTRVMRVNHRGTRHSQLVRISSESEENDHWFSGFWLEKIDADQ